MSLLKSSLFAALDDLAVLARKSSFWDIFRDVFGTSYNALAAETLRKQWHERNFSQLPIVVVTTTSVLGVANAAYANESRTIYVSDRFLSFATATEVRAVLLEEIGHYVDSVVNSSETQGDEGELFSLRARGLTPTASELRRITSENDNGTIAIHGQTLAVETALPVVYESEVINTFAASSGFVGSGPYQISGLNAAWTENVGSNSILYLYNGASKQAIANEAYTGSLNFDISGGTVVYAKKGDIYRYSAGVTTRLTTTTDTEFEPIVDGSTIAWKGWGANSLEVFRRIGSANVQLTNNAFNEESMQLSGNNLIWAAWDGTDYDIFLNNGTTTTALSSNSTDDYDPVISGNRVAWFNWTGSQTNLWYHNGATRSQITTGEDVTRVVLCGTNLAYVAFNKQSNTYSIKFHNTTTKAFTTLASGLIAEPDLQSSSTWVAWIETKSSTTQLRLFSGTSTVNLGAPSQVQSFSLVGKKVVYAQTTSNNSTALFLYDGSGSTPSTTQLTSPELGYGGVGPSSLDIVGNQILRTKYELSARGSLVPSLLLTKPTTKPILTIGNARVVEGLTAPQSVVLTVTLSAASTSTVSVKYETSSEFTGTNAFPGSDFTATTGTLVFAPGQTTGTISIPILDDSFAESDETFQVILSNPVNAAVAPGLDRSTVTITDTLVRSGTTGETFVLPIGVENLTLTGTAGINGTGNANNNIITGNSGNNILNGGGGFSDQLIGGLGNDTYILTQGVFSSSTNPPIKEELNQGIDTVQAVAGNSFSFLALPDNVENLIITGTTFFSALGNGLANNITGNVSGNSLTGGDGIDTVNYSSASAANAAVTINLQMNSASGGSGFDSIFEFENVVGSSFDDTITGNDGANQLRGFRGKDTLTGLGGVDKFDYRVLSDSLLGSTNNSFDRITDFNAAAGGDRLLVPVARAGFLNAGAVTTLNSAGIAAKLTASAFLGHFAASFTLGTGPALRTFVAINDATAGFSAATDAIVEVTPVTGVLGTLGLSNFATA